MRLYGINISDEKRLEIGLTALFGIGRYEARKILDDSGLDYGKKGKDVTAEEENKVRDVIDLRGKKIEGDLKREISENIKRLKDIRAYRGVRHERHLPSRGQRSKTNSRTVRGNVRKTMGSGRRKDAKT